MRGGAHERNFVYELAISDYSQAIRLNRECQPAIADDLGWYKISNREQAIVACSRLLALNPKFAPAYFNRGVAYYARAITTARSPTTAGRSGSIRKTLSPIVGGRSPAKSP
jgi:tetratricopeptide (TPR) repeat protein